MTSYGIRVCFASGRVQIMTPEAFLALPGAMRRGACTSVVLDWIPPQRPGRLARAAAWVGERVDRFLVWLAVTL